MMNSTSAHVALAPPPELRRASSNSTTSSTQESLAPKVSSPPCSKRLRSGLLNKLGIVDNRSQAPAFPGPPLSQQGSVLGPIKIVKAPLKRCQEVEPKPTTILGTLGSLFKVGSPPSSSSSDSNTTMMTDSSTDASSSCSSLEASPQRRPKRCLTFDEQVSVVHIPRREQYSDRIRQHLWHTAEYLQNAVMRNTVEYAADGWNWEDAREEDQHAVCPESGELIHPVHTEIAKLIRHEQGLPEDTPVWTPFWKLTPIPGTNNSNMAPSAPAPLLE